MILDATGQRWFEDRTQPDPFPLFLDESSSRPIGFEHPPEFSGNHVTDYRNPHWMRGNYQGGRSVRRGASLRIGRMIRAGVI